MAPSSRRVSLHRSQRTGRVIWATSLVIASAADSTGRPSAFEEPGQVVARYEPPALHTALGDEVRTARCASRCDGSFDLDAVFVVVARTPTQVAGGDSCEASCFGDRQDVVWGAERSDLVWVHSCVAGIAAPRELGVGHPPGAVRLDGRDQVRPTRDPTGRISATGRPNGRFSGMFSGRWVCHAIADGNLNGNIHRADASRPPANEKCPQ